MLYRTRTHPAIVRYGLYLYFSYRSFRLAARSLSSIKWKRSHVSIWKWVQNYADCAADRFRTDKQRVKEIFVDETLFQIDEGQNYWLWIAYEPNLNVCLMMHLSRERTIFVCYQFFKQL
jgi:transposase-like protein